MVGRKKLRSKPLRKSSSRSSGAVKKTPAAKNVKSAPGSSGRGYSIDYVIALEIQKGFGGSPAPEGDGGRRPTSAQELELRDRTLRRTAAATDRVRKEVEEINAPEKGGMVPARRRPGRPAASRSRNVDRQQLELRNKTLKDTPSDRTPSEKKVENVVAPQRGGMVPAERRGRK